MKRVWHKNIILTKYIDIIIGYLYIKYGQMCWQNMTAYFGNRYLTLEPNQGLIGQLNGSNYDQIDFVSGVPIVLQIG